MQSPPRRFSASYSRSGIGKVRRGARVSLSLSLSFSLSLGSQNINVSIFHEQPHRRLESTGEECRKWSWAG